MIDKIGLQTFTIRNDIKTIVDMEGALRYYNGNGIKRFELARIKFNSEELELLKKLKSELSLSYIASQITLKRILKDFDYLMRFSKELGITYLEVSVIPTLSFLRKKKGIIDLSKKLNELGKRTKEHNVKLLYHHHNYELISYDDKLSLDILIDNTDSDLVNFVCDTYWLARSGYNPAKFIGDRINRIKGLHLRDSKFYHKWSKFDFTDTFIGDGTIDFAEIVKLDKKD